MSHPVENIMRSTMEQLRQMVDVNTIVGSPVETGSGTVLLPVSKVSMGFVSVRYKRKRAHARAAGAV